VTFLKKHTDIAAYLAILIVCSLTWLGLKFLTDMNSTIEGLWTEAFGMLLDIVFLGIIFTLFKEKNSKKDLINRYLEEIDDYRNWKSEEATVRIIGNIKRLQKLDVNTLNLDFCYFGSETDLSSITVKNIIQLNSNFEICTFNNSVFDSCTLKNCNFEGSNIQNTEFLRCDLAGSKLEQSDLEGTLFSNTDISNVSFKHSNLRNVIFNNTKGLKAKQFESVEDLYGARLPKKIQKKLKKRYPKIYQLLQSDKKRIN